MINPILKIDLNYIHHATNPGNKFNGATIVVTGCAGFLGFYFTQYLVRYSTKLGIKKVIGLDNFILEKPEWLKTLKNAYPKIFYFHTFDISKDNIETVCGADKARFVIHGASIASPSFYRKYPLETIDANIWGLRHLLDFYCSSDYLEGFLFFSSSEVYGDPDAGSIPTQESYRGNVACTGPRACYDESKRFGETLCYVFASKHDMPVTVARPFNNYGPGMRLGDKRIPADFAQCVLEDRDLIMLSDGKPTRTFCYVSDAIVGYLLCLLYGKYDVFNIGIEEPEITMNQLANIYQKAGKEIFGYTGQILYKTSPDPEYMTDNPNRRCPTIKKAKEQLNYTPKILVQDGVHLYLNFLKQERLKKTL
ncbi:NAD-dependent epimerase/dehydratase family protein [Vreelandella lionensis]|mgnify:CR=1 FL=1|uniref:NAD-dependent epimerase/dehydratase family protein n=1 Tax=Vreelandella lionensis TaxID=1144478 RepID=A0ABW8BYJ2_9GAMM